jgi:hypothetical protein
MINTTLHTKLKIEQHDPPQKNNDWTKRTPTKKKRMNKTIPHKKTKDWTRRTPTPVVSSIFTELNLVKKKTWQTKIYVIYFTEFLLWLHQSDLPYLLLFLRCVGVVLVMVYVPIITSVVLIKERVVLWLRQT